ncbi:MAG: hypothetical protein ACPL7K_10180, partial [Armatimonadota bacterium]
MSLSTYSLAIRNGNVLLADGHIRQCDVLIESGIVTSVGAGLRGSLEIDASGCYVVPGLIDL